MKDTTKRALLFMGLGSLATIVLAVIALFLVAAGSRFEARAARPSYLEAERGEAKDDAWYPPPAEAKMGASAHDKRKEALRRQVAQKGLNALMAPAAPGAAAALFDGDVGGVAEALKPMESALEAAPAPARAWFPETFLWEPVVPTDESGAAKVDVKVPDRLTSWRVLALAHSREGAQAGTVTSFLGTLPLYVDPVVPAFLTAGDEVRLPLQIVNTTETAATAPLRVEAQGATLAGAPAQVQVPAAGSRVEYVSLKAEQPGTATLAIALGSADRVVRTIPVQPAGQPVEQVLAGTLAAPRTLSIPLPADADPRTTRARLQVFPGALALLRSELAGAPGRGGVAEDAYTLLLSGRAAALLRSLGEEPDAERLRALSILAAQRAVRHGRSPDVPTAALLAEGALAHEGNPILSRLGERLASQVARAQRPDGTCEGGTGWTLQRLLVTTAECVRAVRAFSSSAAGRQQAAAVALRAGAAYERNADAVRDGFTAAALLAGGGLPAPVAEKLKKVVREAVKSREDGSKYLPVEDNVVRADGLRPSWAEATALAVLGLDPQEDAALRADLGSWLLGSYSAWRGWGDGRANLAALQAVLALFRDPLPARVQILLQMDGRTVAEGALDPKTVRDVLSLEADATGANGEHQWTLKAEPPVPGLGYSLSVKGWVPWKKEPPLGGLELAVTAQGPAKVGKPLTVQLDAAAPAGADLVLRYALPAGVQADPRSLDQLVSEGKLSRYRAEDGLVVMDVPALAPGKRFSAAIRVIPTLAGKLNASASSVAMAALGGEHHVPSPVWTVGN